MISIILSGFIGLIVNIFSTLAGPLFSLIGNNFSAIPNFSQYIVSFLNTAASCIGWVINSLGLGAAMQIVIIYWTGVLAIALPVRLVKIVLRWYRILMP